MFSLQKNQVRNLIFSFCAWARVGWMGSHQREKGLWLTLLFRERQSWHVSGVNFPVLANVEFLRVMMFGLDWLREGLDKGAGCDPEMELHCEGRRRRRRKGKEMVATLFCCQPTMKRKKAKEWSGGWYPLSLPLGCTSCSIFYTLFISIFWI